MNNLIITNLIECGEDGVGNIAFLDCFHIALLPCFERMLILCDRLRQVISELEIMQSSMVSPEVVENHLHTIDHLQGELRHFDVKHKQLMQRYNAVKSAIDVAYRRHEVRSREGGEMPGILNPLVGKWLQPYSKIVK